MKFLFGIVTFILCMQLYGQQKNVANIEKFNPRVEVFKHPGDVLELKQAREIEKANTELKATQSQLIQTKKIASPGELTAGVGVLNLETKEGKGLPVGETGAEFIIQLMINQ